MVTKGSTRDLSSSRPDRSAPSMVAKVRLPTSATRTAAVISQPRWPSTDGFQAMLASVIGPSSMRHAEIGVDDPPMAFSPRPACRRRSCGHIRAPPPGRTGPSPRPCQSLISDGRAALVRHVEDEAALRPPFSSRFMPAIGLSSSSIRLAWPAPAKLDPLLQAIIRQLADRHLADMLDSRKSMISLTNLVMPDLLAHAGPWRQPPEEARNSSSGCGWP